MYTNHGRKRKKQGHMLAHSDAPVLHIQNTQGKKTPDCSSSYANKVAG